MRNLIALVAAGLGVVACESETVSGTPDGGTTRPDVQVTDVSVDQGPQDSSPEDTSLDDARSEPSPESGAWDGMGTADAPSDGDRSDTDRPDSGLSDASEERDSTARDVPADAPTALRHHFRRVVLSSEFNCEGASFADFDRDGDMDVVFGPRWYEGPSFTVAHELYAPHPYDPHLYADCFFLFAHDVNNDGRADVIRVGFPETDASWFEQPASNSDRWPLHTIVNVVGNESPHFNDITGDDRPELIFVSGGALGWATPDTADPTRPWIWHPLTPSAMFPMYMHGLGVGDLDKDGLLDVVEPTGWWKHPPSLSGDPIWERRPQTFGSGGAQMGVTDVDGDGDADVITSLEAHGYGLAWYEQSTAGFTEHIIVPRDPDAGGVPMHEPHGLALADVDKDGDQDIITGERFWAHTPPGMPDFNAPARIYWFELVRGPSGVTFVPHLIDDASGVGTQVTVGDVTGDGLVDIVIGNKKGAFVFVHEVTPIADP